MSVAALGVVFGVSTGVVARWQTGPPSTDRAQPTLMLPVFGGVTIKVVTSFIAAPEASHLDARIAALTAGWVLSVPSVIWLNVLVRRRRNRAIAKLD